MTIPQALPLATKLLLTLLSSFDFTLFPAIHPIFKVPFILWRTTHAYSPNFFIFAQRSFAISSEIPLLIQPLMPFSSEPRTKYSPYSSRMAAIFFSCVIYEAFYPHILELMISLIPCPRRQGYDLSFQVQLSIHFHLPTTQSEPPVEC